LRNLRSRIGEDAEFASQTKSIQQEIDAQADR
jgi:hypothetical protein